MKSEIEISPYGSLLVYKTGYSTEDVHSIIKENNLRGLRIFAHLKDGRLGDLNFLSEFTFLEVLDITSVEDYDFKFLRDLKNLRELSINAPGQNPIDLSHQRNLEFLTIDWRKGKIMGLKECININSLCLINYAEVDFMPITDLVKIKNLTIKTSQIKTCNGIERLNNLESVLLGNCRKLSDIEAMRNLKNITSVAFQICPHISNYSSLGYLTKLEKLEITDCKGVNSIIFLNRLPSLKRMLLLGNTDVLDGDLTPAKRIQEVLYKHRKHYNVVIDNKNYDNVVRKNIKGMKDLFE